MLEASIGNRPKIGLIGESSVYHGDGGLQYPPLLLPKAPRRREAEHCGWDRALEFTKGGLRVS